MVRIGLLALLAVTTVATASAQPAPAVGQRSYGSGTFTISCLQGGKVALQLPRVWAIEESWNRDNRIVQYRQADGAPGTFNYNSENMTCLVEFWGQESVPVTARIAEEEQRKAREREALETHQRLLRQAQ
jgi:hypothetical protein